MDYKINKIQQYFINKQDNKNFANNIENLGPNDVKQIVSILLLENILKFLNIYLYISF